MEKVTENRCEISVIMCVMNRTQRLVMASRGWINHPLVSEMIVVDWSSENPVSEDTEVKVLLNEFPNIKIIRVEDQKYFSISAAQNIGLRHTTRNIVVKVDSDIVLINPICLFEAAQEIKSHDAVFYTGRNHHEQGTILAARKMMIEVGGWREDFEGWGADDCYFYEKLRECGGQQKRFAPNVLEHCPHDDSLRVSNYEIQSKERTANHNSKLWPRKPLLPLKEYDEKELSPQLILLHQKCKTIEKPLFPLTTWSPAFGQHKGKKVNHPNLIAGNANDHLIWEAIYRLYEFFELSPVHNEWEVFMWPGGCNMGDLNSEIGRRRMQMFVKARDQGVPVVVLPQSWGSQDQSAEEASQCWRRDNVSQTYTSRSRFLPDVSLAWTGKVGITDCKIAEKYFFRQECASVDSTECGGDPEEYCLSAEKFLSLAAACDEVHTDVSSFAIACLIVGTSVTLYPGEDSINESIWRATLQKLGCAWSAKIL